MTDLSLKTLLDRDFGFDLNIAGGRGKKEDPIIVLDATIPEASFTEMQVLRGIGMGREVHWRTLSRNPVSVANRLIEKLEIETKETTSTEIITQTEVYYFDVSAAGSGGTLHPAVIAFRQKDAVGNFPYELGWLHYSVTTDYERQAAGSGIGIAYGAPAIKATVFLYDKTLPYIPSELDSSVIHDEFEVCVAELLAADPTASLSSEVRRGRCIFIRAFNIGEAWSLLALGVFNGQFAKLRVTFERDLFLADIANESILAFQDAIEVRGSET